MPKTNSLKKKRYLFQVSLINGKKGFCLERLGKM